MEDIPESNIPKGFGGSAGLLGWHRDGLSKHWQEGGGQVQVLLPVPKLN